MSNLSPAYRHAHFLLQTCRAFLGRPVGETTRPFSLLEHRAPSKPAPKPASPDYSRKLELYERLVATNPKVQRKGDTMPYTSVNGNMFSLLTRSGTLALRLPAKEREPFLRTYSTKLTEQYGIVMKEYVDVPDSLLADTRALAKHFAASYAYVSALRTKPTIKPKKTVAKKAAPGKKAPPSSKGGPAKKSR